MFTVFTDHKNLTFPRKPELLSQRQIRWNLFLTRFDFEIHYRPGKGGKPDAFSRRADYIKKENEEINEDETNICLTVREIEEFLSNLAIQGSLKEDFIKTSGEDKEIAEIRKMMNKGIQVNKNYAKLLNHFLWTLSPICQSQEIKPLLW